MGGLQYTVRRQDLLFPELSFQINGALFDVYKQLGGGHKEKYYQNAVSISLQKRGLRFKEQFYAPLTFDGKLVGKNYLDFLVEDKIILELKRGRYLPINVLTQTKEYLATLNLQLAIVGCFAEDSVLIKRIVNIH